MSVIPKKWRDANGKLHQRWQISIAGFRHADGREEPRIRVVSPVNTRRGAEEHERQIRQSLAAGTYGKEQASTVPTLRAFAPEYLTEAETSNKPLSVRAKRGHLDLHLLPAFGDLKLTEISAARVDAFKVELIKRLSQTHVRKENASQSAKARRYGAGPKALSKKTINNILTTLKRALALAAERYAVVPPRIKLFKTLKPDFDFLDFDEAERVIAAAPAEWRTMILTAIKSGLRTGELIGLQWTDVDLKRAVIQVRRTISKGVESLPKGGRTRTVDMPASLVEAFSAARHIRGPFVFCEPTGARLTEGKMKGPLRGALKRAGVARPVGSVGWHDLRHTYGSHLAMRGIPPKAIQELMGHSTLEMTNRYMHLAPAVKAHAVNALDAPAPGGPTNVIGGVTNAVGGISRGTGVTHGAKPPGNRA